MIFPRDLDVAGAAEWWCQPLGDKRKASVVVANKGSASWDNGDDSSWAVRLITEMKEMTHRHTSTQH